MTEQPRPSNEDALGFLRELVDRYGIDGLTERLAAAIEEAEAGRVDAQLWTKRPSGWNKNKAPSSSLAGEGRLTFSASGGSASTGTGYPRLSGSGTLAATAPITGDGVVQKSVEDVVAVSDRAAVTVTDTARVFAAALPTNMQVIAQVQEICWYLINLWNLTQTPEVIPFALLLALAIVVTRIRIKQAHR